MPHAVSCERYRASHNVRSSRVPTGAVLLIFAVLTLAAWLVAHVALLVRIAVSPVATSRGRWMSLVPFFAPFVGWRARLRAHVIVWACLVALYVGLRIALAPS